MRLPTRLQKALIAGLVLAVAFLDLPVSVSAQYDCSQSDPCAGKSAEEKVSCYSEVVSVCGKNRESLSAAITTLDGKINLTTINIENIRKTIEQLNTEIDELADEVVRLESEMKQQMELVIRRVPEAYKRESTSQFGMVLFASNISDFVARVRYADQIQKHTINTLFQLKLTQNNFNQRKLLREQKVAKRDQTKKDLEVQMVQLDKQKKEKNALLAVTQGNEQKYASLLKQAREQLAAIKRYVSSDGGATVLSNQTVCNDWGCYYNQRDSEWANQAMGNSGESVKEVGCLISSVAMVATHYKKNLKPSDVAAESSAFLAPSTAYLLFSINVRGVSISRSRIGRAGIDGELAAGRPVIVGVYGGPAHFIVLKSGSNGNYVMNDPFMENGHDVPFTSKYSINDITEVDAVSVN